MITTVSLVDSYLEHERLLGKSKATIEAYSGALKLLQGALRIDDWRDVVPADLEAYWISVKGRVARESAYLYLRAVKVFFRFLVESNRLLVDPSSGLPLPDLNRSQVRPVLSLEEFERLIAACDVGKLTGLRDRALLEFLYSTGLRVSELCQLKEQDLDLEQQIVAIRRGKGSKDRMLPLNQVAVQWLRRYLAEGRPALNKFHPEVDELFISWRGRRFKRLVMNIHLKELGRRAKLPIHLTCHVIRRTLATMMLRNGATPHQVAALLGHEDLRSLSRYVRIVAKEIKETHSKTHPREAEVEHES